MISAIKIIGSLVYRTRKELRDNQKFLQNVEGYEYAASCFHEGRLNFLHIPGTHPEIVKKINSLTPADAGGNNRYPALFNFQNIDQDRSNELFVNYNLAFVAPVYSDWITERREKEAFEKMLRPLYEEFMRQLKKSGYFWIGSGLYPSHRYVEVFTTQDNSGELIKRYGDHIDAIEVRNLRLKLRKLCDLDIKRIDEENDLLKRNL